MTDRLPDSEVTVPNSADVTQGQESFAISQNIRHPRNHPPGQVDVLNPAGVPSEQNPIDMIGDGVSNTKPVRGTQSPAQKRPGQSPNVPGQ